MAYKGRFEKDIDWKKADRLLEAGCTGIEISGYFHMHPDTFYRRIMKEKGVVFTDYQRLKYNRGNSDLRDKQHSIAIEGDGKMLVWLGKTRLKQKETQVIEIDNSLSDFPQWLGKQSKDKEGEE